jgi:hypothetical protein
MELVGALNEKRQARYPGYSIDPLDAFRDFRHDLELFGGPFLTGAMTEEDMSRLAADVHQHPKHGLP